MLTNYNKIKLCLSYANERHFSICPPKKPFLLFMSKEKYRKKIIAEREELLFSKLDKLMGPSNQISFSSLWFEFGDRDSFSLLLKWIEILSHEPLKSQEYVKRLYLEAQQQRENFSINRETNQHYSRISYQPQPLTRYVISRLRNVDIGVDNELQ